MQIYNSKHNKLFSVYNDGKHWVLKILEKISEECTVYTVQEANIRDAHEREKVKR